MARNTVGYGGAYMSLTVQSVSAPVAVIQAPTNLTATLQAGPQVSLTWMDNATNETGFSVERSTDGVTFVQIATAPARNNTGNVTFVDTTVTWDDLHLPGGGGQRRRVIRLLEHGQHQPHRSGSSL